MNVILNFLIGVVLGGFMSDLRVENNKKRKKSEEIFSYLFRLYPTFAIVGYITYFIYVELFGVINNIATDIFSHFICILVCCTFNYWVLFIYRYNMKKLYGDNKEIQQFVLYSLLVLLSVVLALLFSFKILSLSLCLGLCLVLLSIYAFKYCYVIKQHYVVVR